MFRRVPEFLSSARGSSVVGFALVAPLLVGVFVAVTQIVMVVADKATISSAAIAGARDASTANASLAKGMTKAHHILASKEMLSRSTKISASRQRSSGVDFVQMTVECDVKVPWLNQIIHISSTSRSLDEHAL